MTPAAIAESFRRFRDANPQPTTELEYTSTFELLIAVILSAQATDKGVNKATRRLFPVANTPAAILALGEDGLKDYIKTIGLYNTKAVNILKTCQILLDEHGGAVPADRAARWPDAVAVRLSRAQQPSTRTAADGTSRTVPAQASHEIILILVPDPWRVAEVLPAEQ